MNGHPSLTGQVNVRESEDSLFFLFFIFLFTTTHLPVFTLENHFSGGSIGLRQYYLEDLDLIFSSDTVSVLCSSL